MSGSLRILLRTDDPVRRQGLGTMLESAGHMLVTDTPDVVLCDLRHEIEPPAEAEAPVLALTDEAIRGEEPAGVLPRAVTLAQLDPALHAVAAGLLVRAPGSAPHDGFGAAVDDTPPLLTPRETEILSLVGQGMSNKAVARALGISVHTVKFHLEALFAKLDATSRAEAVAKGLRGGVIEL
jgi:two-component system, NarL family, nitrate/nitrite response regulator NarL